MYFTIVNDMKVIWDRTGEIVDWFGPYDFEETVEGMDEDGNEYVGTAVISCDEIVDVEDVEMTKATPDSDVPIYYNHVMRKKDRFGIDVIKPVRFEITPDFDLEAAKEMAMRAFEEGHGIELYDGGQ